MAERLPVWWHRVPLRSLGVGGGFGVGLGARLPLRSRMGQLARSFPRWPVRGLGADTAQLRLGRRRRGGGRVLRRHAMGVLSQPLRVLAARAQPPRTRPFAHERGGSPNQTLSPSGRRARAFAQRSRCPQVTSSGDARPSCPQASRRGRHAAIAEQSARVSASRPAAKQRRTGTRGRSSPRSEVVGERARGRGHCSPSSPAVAALEQRRSRPAPAAVDFARAACVSRTRLVACGSDIEGGSQRAACSPAGARRPPAAHHSSPERGSPTRTRQACALVALAALAALTR